MYTYYTYTHLNTCICVYIQKHFPAKTINFSFPVAIFLHTYPHQITLLLKNN